MSYSIQVRRLYNFDGEEIGVDVLLIQYDSDDNVVDWEDDYTVYRLDFDGDSEIDDADWLVEKEFETAEAAREEFEWQKATIKNYLD